MTGMSRLAIVTFSDAGWSSLAARRAHNPKVTGSNPVPATTQTPEIQGFFISATVNNFLNLSILVVKCRGRYDKFTTNYGMTFLHQSRTVINIVLQNIFWYDFDWFLNGVFRFLKSLDFHGRFWKDSSMLKFFKKSERKKLTTRSAILAAIITIFSAWGLVGLDGAIPEFLGFFLFVASAGTLASFAFDLGTSFLAVARNKIDRVFFGFVSRRASRTFSVESSVILTGKIVSKIKVLPKFLAARKKKTDFSLLLGAALRAMLLAPSFPRIRPA